MSEYRDSRNEFAKGQTERPDYVTDEHLEYLDDLRESGATNMFGAGQWLREEFAVDRATASGILGYWMKTFGERQKAASLAQETGGERR